MVWKCPVCSHSQPVQPEVCSVCGYEESADREKHPTLTCPAKKASSYSGKIRQWEESRRQKEREEQERRERAEDAARQEKWKREIEARRLERERRQRLEREYKALGTIVSTSQTSAPTVKLQEKKALVNGSGFV